MKVEIAKYISIIGHPLITLPLFTIITLFNYEDFQRAFLISSLIVGGIFIPLTIKMYRGTKHGKYTNFDVSDKSQRQSWYLFALILLLIVTIIMYATEQAPTLRLKILFAFLLLLTSQVINYFIKSSLHVSLNIFLSFLILPINMPIGILFFVFVAFIAWSRLILNRHTLKEIIVGAIIGFIIGFASFCTSELL